MKRFLCLLFLTGAAQATDVAAILLTPCVGESTLLIVRADGTIEETYAPQKNHKLIHRLEAIPAASRHRVNVPCLFTILPQELANGY